MARYEAVRHSALCKGNGAFGLETALLMAKGMGAWMRGWQACSQSAMPGRSTGAPPQAEIVAVLATMALACAEGGR